ncbi:MAG: hypothetical protein KIT09_24505 [Bryobacteraceae bacterium]|nr:hypothetical protein [Bryobacteraceae bacterium]
MLVVVAAAALLSAETKERGLRVRVPLWAATDEPLTADRLTARVDGKPVEILELRNPSEDLMILLVLDMVSDLNEIELARKAMLSAIQEIPPNVYIGVLRAQEGLRVLVDPTTDREAVAEAIQTFPISGTPGLLETVETAARLADAILAKANVRLAVFYVTDSNIYRYREDFSNPVINYSDSQDLSRRFPEGLVRNRISKLNAALSGALAPLFVVHLEYETDRLNEAYQNGLMQLTSTTGGNSSFCRSNAEIGPAIEATFKSILSHYSLDLLVDAKKGDNITVTLESPNNNLSYRNRFHIGK